MQSKISMELLVKKNFRARKEGKELHNGLIYLVWFNPILFCAKCVIALCCRYSVSVDFSIAQSLGNIVNNTGMLSICTMLPCVSPELEIFMTT